MKHTFITMSMFLALAAFSQNKNCVTPISNFEFQQLITNLNGKTDEAQKLVFSKKIAREKCLSTEQVKQIAETFGNDYNRLAFVQSAYENTTDKDNFYEVYNSFTYFSNVFRLHDYVSERKAGSKTNPEISQNKEMTFPDYDYPDYRKYFGKIGCMSILGEDSFLERAQMVYSEPTDEKKLSKALNISANNCLQTAQIMKIASLMQGETFRLEFLKKAYEKVFDPDNYKKVLQVLTAEKSKKEFDVFLGGGTTIITTVNPPCEVSATDFADVKKQISRPSVTNLKINVAKQLIKDKKCFKTSQIIEILTLFPYSDAKMDIAKYAYDYTTDKENYSKITDSFSFTKDKEDFLKFLKSK